MKEKSVEFVEAGAEVYAEPATPLSDVVPRLHVIVNPTPDDPTLELTKPRPRWARRWCRYG